MEMAEKLLNEAAAAIAAMDLPAAQRAIKLALAEPVDWPLRGHVLHGAAFVYRRAGLIHESLRYWEAFFQGAASNGGISERKLVESHYIYGLTLRQARCYADAVTEYAQAAAGFEALSDRAGCCAAWTNLAWAACHAGQLGVARDALDQAEVICKTAGERQHLDLSNALHFHYKGCSADAAQMCIEILNCEADNEVKADAAYILGVIYAASGRSAEVGPMVQLVENHGNDSRHTANAELLAERVRRAN